MDEFTAPCVRGRGLRSKCTQLGLNKSDAAHPHFSLEAGCLKRTLAVKSNSTIKELYLDDSNIGDEGAMALANALKSNMTLQELCLHSSNIGDKGAMALAEALKSDSTLQELVHLAYNNIGDKGAMALADALKNNSTLHTLGLCSNNIGDEGVMALADALTSNSALYTLGISFFVMRAFEFCRTEETTMESKGTTKRRLASD